MVWTDREQKRMNAIIQWEEEHFTHHATDVERTFQKWYDYQLNQLESPTKNRLYAVIDSALFHMHSLIQNSQSQVDASHRLLTDARLFDPRIEQIQDMKTLSIDHLVYIADQQIARQRMVSLAQGGLAGTGSFLLLGLDIPAVLAINLRTVQLIAMTYGYPVNYPSEMMIALKVFHMATLPKVLQEQAWKALEEEIKHEQTHPYFYEGPEEIADGNWLQGPMKQIIKGTVLMMLRKKVIQGIPLLGIAIGAGVNYRFARTVSETAHKFYQKRFLNELEKGDVG
ncbi:EcsC family protein [Alkalihalobacillus hwajinpoensis]|uniref:EcsC family protein n=1 Tax=Guptibacillus hwajinpoensis TaxID=208199 RepID=UPI001884350D|nr:EcsC family protein [Pseudalkalibacillus hwajinpoensis]MBF0706240.1 EcsC family protein [Pseudalkalibacillus hwajinpoensis]